MANKDTPKWLHEITEILGWIRIVLSPALVGLVAGGLFYLYSPNNTGKLVAIITTAIGMVTGVVWATNIKRKQGTIPFLSRLTAPPENVAVTDED